MHRKILNFEQKMARELSHLSICWPGNGCCFTPVGCFQRAKTLQTGVKSSNKLISIPLSVVFLPRPKTVDVNAPDPIALTSQSTNIDILKLVHSRGQTYFHTGKKFMTFQNHSKQLRDIPKSWKQILHLSKCSTIFSLFCTSIMKCCRKLPI